MSVQSVAYHRIKYLPTVKRIPDELWDEIRLILPPEKPTNTIGRPAVSFRKILDGILYVLRTGYQWKMLSNEYGSGSTCHRRFQQWATSKVFQRLWSRLLKVYDRFIDESYKNYNCALLDQYRFYSRARNRRRKIVFLVC